MKYIFASDIHGSAKYCREVLEIFDREKADRLVLLGDILYHGPRNDLPEGYAPKEVAAMLNEHASELLCVRGNCEAEVDQMVLNFPVMADYAVIDNGKRRIYVTHGHRYNIENPLPMSSGDVLMYGHTHVPLDEQRQGIRYMNPGSVSLPKNGTGRGVYVFEDDEFEWKSLEP